MLFLMEAGQCIYDYRLYTLHHPNCPHPEPLYVVTFFVWSCSIITILFWPERELSSSKIKSRKTGRDSNDWICKLWSVLELNLNLSDVANWVEIKDNSFHPELLRRVERISRSYNDLFCFSEIKLWAITRLGCQTGELPSVLVLLFS